MKSATITSPSRFASSPLVFQLVQGIQFTGDWQDDLRLDGYDIKEAVDNFVNASLVYVSLIILFDGSASCVIMDSM